MCIVCDINVLPDVFSSTENDFTPIRDWIIKGKRGKFVYGGSSYLKELEKIGTYLRILKLLGDQNKTVVLDENSVDAIEMEIKKEIDQKCDDPHIVAILAVSSCKLICSKDKKSYKFIKGSNFYSQGYHPKIYSKKSNSNLLVSRNISKCC